MHLLLDVAEDGRLFMTRELDESDADSIVEALASMPETCALDVAARGGASPFKISLVMGATSREIKDTIAGALQSLNREYDPDDFDEKEHPEDFYIRYSNMGADEIAEISSILKRRSRGEDPVDGTICHHHKKREMCPRCYISRRYADRRKPREDG
jgi:hypothetical protein